MKLRIGLGEQDKKDRRDHQKIVVSAKIETEDKAEGEQSDLSSPRRRSVCLFWGEGERESCRKFESGLPSFALSFDSSSVKRRGRRSRRSRRRKALSVCRYESEISRAIVQIEQGSEREGGGRKSSVIGGSYDAARRLRVLLLRSSRPIDGVRMRRRRRKQTNMELSLDVLWPRQKRLCV